MLNATFWPATYGMTIPRITIRSPSSANDGLPWACWMTSLKLPLAGVATGGGVLGVVGVVAGGVSAAQAAFAATSPQHRTAADRKLESTHLKATRRIVCARGDGNAEGNV